MISLVLPCLNEAKTLGHCIEEARVAFEQTKHPFEIIVADNSSKDSSASLAQQLGAKVVLVQEIGYGAALRAGIEAAAGEIIAYGDSDQSYSFQELPQLLEPIFKGEADLVLGTRLNGTIANGAMPWLNRFVGTPTLTTLLRFIHGIQVTDCNSGFRAIRKEKYKTLNVQASGMEFASEILIRAAKEKLRYREVPISYRKDGRKGPGHLKIWRDGWRHLSLILKI